MAFGTALAMPHLGHYRPFGRHEDTDTEPFPEVPSIEVMSPSSPTNSSFRGRDTGFPEPFNEDRNTTLPYPGADLSPNARITMEGSQMNADPFSTRRHSSRRSRLNKHKRTVSYGRIAPQYEALGSVLSVDTASGGEGGEIGNTSERARAGTASTVNTVNTLSATNTAPTAPATSRAVATPISASFSSPRTSRDETDSLGSKRDDETPPSSPDSRTSSRKGGFLSRWRRSRG